MLDDAARLQQEVRRWVDPLVPLVRAIYGRRLRSLALFGSAGRGSFRPGSDLDLILVVDDLPLGRTARLAEWMEVDRRWREAIAAGLTGGVGGGRPPELSPILKTPAELEEGSPLLFDMVEDARILFDPTAVLAGRLERLRARMRALGSRRIWRGNAWFWDLKPDYRPGEVFDL